MLSAYEAGAPMQRGALQFLVGATGATTGVLALARAGSALEIVAKLGETPLPAGFNPALEAFWSDICGQWNDATDTLELDQIEEMRAAAPEPIWVADSGDIYQRYVLPAPTGARLEPIGVAALHVSAEGARPIRHDLLAVVGRVLR